MAYSTHCASSYEVQCLLHISGSSDVLTRARARARARTHTHTHTHPRACRVSIGREIDATGTQEAAVLALDSIADALKDIAMPVGTKHTTSKLVTLVLQPRPQGGVGAEGEEGGGKAKRRK